MDDARLSLIRENYLRVCDQIADATIRSGRVPGTVRLVTVTKSQPVEVIRVAIAAGAKLLGENYTDEAVSKMDVINDKEVKWHMIGHVQSRKAEQVARYFDMIHSVDSDKLAGRLDRSCALAGRTLPALLEVNVSGEVSKFGLPAWEERMWPELEPVIKKIMVFPHLNLMGLMTMPPFTDDPEQTRPYFQRMRRLQQYLINRVPQVKWAELSMGTSSDFRAAVEEGATIVRVGRSILGERPVE